MCAIQAYHLYRDCPGRIQAHHLHRGGDDPGGRGREAGRGGIGVSWWVSLYLSSLAQSGGVHGKTILLAYHINVTSRLHWISNGHQSFKHT